MEISKDENHQIHGLSAEGVGADGGRTGGGYSGGSRGCICRCDGWPGGDEGHSGGKFVLWNAPRPEIAEEMVIVSIEDW